MNINEIIDLHNHTDWSDGANTIDELIQNSIKHNVKAIGITDHYNTHKCASVSPKELNKYIKALSLAKSEYKGKIKVLRGIEINCIPYKNINEIQFDAINKLDYVLVEYLEYLKPSISLEDIFEFISKFEIKVGLAHTDLIKFASRYNDLEEGLRKILSLMKSHNVFWELNTNSSGDSYYDFIVSPNENIKLLKNLIKEYNIEVSVGSDTHDILDYEFKRLEEANIILKEFNLINIEIF